MRLAIRINTNIVGKFGFVVWCRFPWYVIDMKYVTCYQCDKAITQWMSGQVKPVWVCGYFSHAMGRSIRKGPIYTKQSASECSFTNFSGTLTWTNLSKRECSDTHFCMTVTWTIQSTRGCSDTYFHKMSTWTNLSTRGCCDTDFYKMSTWTNLSTWGCSSTNSSTMPIWTILSTRGSSDTYFCMTLKQICLHESVLTHIYVWHLNKSVYKRVFWHIFLYDT